MADLRLQSGPTPDSFSPPTNQPADSGSASNSAPISAPEPTLTRELSSSKLSAKAPEFVPIKTPPMTRSPSPVDARMVIVPPSLPPPVMHVYQQNPMLPVGMPAPIIHPQQGQQYHHPHLQSHSQHHNQHSGQHQKHHHSVSGGAGEQEGVAQSHQASSHGKDHLGNGASSNGLSEEATQKILNQVEFYFSDINLATTDHLVRFMRKDPEGYVPMSVVASFKKIKALVSTDAQLAAVLRSSTKLVVSKDGKKVKRLHHLKGPDMEELQCRIIVAENLPEDHCHQNLMKIFSSIGSVKAIRTCQPTPVSSEAATASKLSKADNTNYSNKLHAFVEYESLELAEQAVLELNGGSDWRNGLRIRLLKRPSKSQQARGRRAGSESEGTDEEDSTSTSEPNDRLSKDNSAQSDLHSLEIPGEEQGNEFEGGAQRKGRNRGRGKGRGRVLNHQTSRGPHHIGSSPPASLASNSSEQHTTVVANKQPPGPRMPDGTRGFTMGRGKPVTVNAAS